jgi:transposase-like protein
MSETQAGKANGASKDKDKGNPFEVGVHKGPKGRNVYSADFRAKILGEVLAAPSITKQNEVLTAHGISRHLYRKWRQRAAAERKQGKAAKRAKANKSNRYEDGVGHTAVPDVNNQQRIAMRFAKGEPGQAIAKEFSIGLSSVYYYARKWNKGKLQGGKAPKVSAYLEGKKLKRSVSEIVSGEAPPLSVSVKDAISFLRHAKLEAYAQLMKGAIKEFDQSHVYAMLALKELEKGI